MESGSIDYWREYFRTAKSDVFSVIHQAIVVAAADYPEEFRIQRDGIAEKLFCCRFMQCSSEGVESTVTGQLPSPVISDDDNENQINNNYSYVDAEALNDEIEQAHQTINEVLRIKDILLNKQDESDTVLFDSLRRLQLMGLTVDILKETEIGKAVNGIRKHGTTQIRQLARTLIEGWKDMVDEWVNVTKFVSGEKGTPDSVNPSVTIDEEEEEGLPSPPLDEGVFFATQPISMELSQFFDGIDEDGNPLNNCENGRRTLPKNQSITKRKQQKPVEATKEDQYHLVKRQETVVKTSNNSIAAPGPGRPHKVNLEKKSVSGSKLQQRLDMEEIVQKQPISTQEGRLKYSDDRKLEATKRKLLERYQEVENAKKQRTIQVMELHDIPKQGVGRAAHTNRQRPPHARR